MHLTKDSPIIVTKSQYTAEEFIQKKIELLVRLRCFLLHDFSSLFRKIKWNHSTLSIWKTYAINMFGGSLYCLALHPTMVSRIIKPILIASISRLSLAIKCNDDVNVIKLLAFLGAGFDCASKVISIISRKTDCFLTIVFQGEIKKVMDLGVSGAFAGHLR